MSAGQTEGLGSYSYALILMYGWPLIHLFITGISAFVFALEAKIGEVQKYVGLIIAFQVLSPIFIILLGLLFNNVVDKPYGLLIGTIAFYLVSIPITLLISKK